MKRFWRITFNVLTAVSALLWVATIVLWVRSYWVMDYVHYRTIYHPLPGPGYTLMYADSLRGNCGFSIGRYVERDPYPLDTHWAYEHGDAAGVVIPVRIGRSFAYITASDPAYWHYLVWFPTAMLLLPFGISPMFWSYTRLRYFSARRKSGLCPACGYDTAPRPNNAQSAARKSHRLHHQPRSGGRI